MSRRDPQRGVNRRGDSNRINPANFDPRTIADCTGWWRSDLGVTTVSGNVSAWACQVTGDSNKDFVQSTVGKRPIYNTSDSDWGGLPSLESTGAQSMQTGTWAVSIPQPSTYICIGRLTSATGGAREFIDGLTAQRQIVYSAVTSGNIQSFGSTPLTGAGVSWLNQKRIVLVGANGASTPIYIDDSVTAKVTGNQGNSTPTGLYLGYPPADSSTWIGEWMELIIYRRLLTAPERAQIFAYAGARYGQAWA